MNRPTKWKWIISIAVIAASPNAGADEIKAGGGVDCSSGKYGQSEPTVICFYPYNLHAFTGPYEFKLSFPYIDIRGEGGTRGFGDMSFYAGKTVAENFWGNDALGFDFKVKARNGSVAKGLGTGRLAYNAGLTWVSLVDTRHLYLFYYGLTWGNRPEKKVGSYTTLWYKYLSSDDLRWGLIYENNEIGYSRRIETLSFMPEIALNKRLLLKPFVYMGINAFAPSKGVGMVASYSFFL